MSLTATEFRILHALMERPARVYSRDELIEAMHGGDDPGIIDRTVESTWGGCAASWVTTLHAPRFIETVRSVGYRFARPVEREEMEPAP